jgi:hypothetical protein
MNFISGYFVILYDLLKRYLQFARVQNDTDSLSSLDGSFLQSSLACNLWVTRLTHVVHIIC